MYKHNRFKTVKVFIAPLLLSFISQPAKSAISLDRTRIIYDGKQNSISVNISNDNTQLPYLAQAWLEGNDNKKITNGPLVVTPPVHRLEPGAKSMVRISITPGTKSLPQDRESLFYFNLREIPPKSDKPNVLQLALQTKIKLFYRPESIKPGVNEIWQEKLVLHKTNNGYKIENPTPYFITIIGFGDSEKGAREGKFESLMLEPKSERNIRADNYKTPWVTYINDYGGRPSLQFNCTGNICHAVKN